MARLRGVRPDLRQRWRHRTGNQLHQLGAFLQDLMALLGLGDDQQPALVANFLNRLVAGAPLTTDFNYTNEDRSPAPAPSLTRGADRIA